MINPHRSALYDPEDHALLGFTLEDTTGWQAQTIFGYTISRTATRSAAEDVLRQQGTAILKGVWQYFDEDDHQWYPCVIKDAKEHQVTVLRTNDMGYLNPETYKMYTIKEPSDSTLVKA